MTVSEGSIPCDEREWSSRDEIEKKESRSSTSSSNESSGVVDPALDVRVRSNKPKGPINLVLKTRISKASQRELERDLMQTETKSTMRTSFTRSTEFAKAEEEKTVTDDGPVVQEGLKEEEVYKKLSELKIVPPIDDVPKVVTTPEMSTSTYKTTPATSPSSSSSFKTAYETPMMDFPPDQPNFDREDSSESDSVISDISGLTGAFTRRSQAADESLAAPREVEKSSPLVQVVPLLPYEEQEALKPPPLHQVTSASTTSKQSSKRKARRVSFSTVCIREYERILGDNPSCSCGPSIGIGWEFDEVEILPVDEWESWRETEREPDRLVLCREEREELLLDLGYNHKVIAQAVRDIIKLKNKRRQTIHNLHASGMEELMESAGRKVKNFRKVKGILSLGKKKKRNDEDDDEESVYA